MGVAQAGGFCSDRDFVVIAPVCAVVEIDLLGDADTFINNKSSPPQCGVRRTFC